MPRTKRDEDVPAPSPRGEDGNSLKELLPDWHREPAEASVPEAEEDPAE